MVNLKNPSNEFNSEFSVATTMRDCKWQIYGIINSYDAFAKFPTN